MNIEQQPPHQIWVPYNAKIADVTHADTNKHTLDLQTLLSETRKIIAVIVAHVRITGTAVMYFYPNEGARSTNDAWETSTWHTIIIADGTQRVQYSLDTANDDFDVYCLGYIVRSRW